MRGTAAMLRAGYCIMVGVPGRCQRTVSGQATVKPKGASRKRRTFGDVTFRMVDGGEDRLANIIPKDPDGNKAAIQ